MPPKNVRGRGAVGRGMRADADPSFLDEVDTDLVDSNVGESAKATGRRRAAQAFDSFEVVDSIVYRRNEPPSRVLFDPKSPLPSSSLRGLRRGGTVGQVQAEGVVPRSTVARDDPRMGKDPKYEHDVGTRHILWDPSNPLPVRPLRDPNVRNDSQVTNPSDDFIKVGERHLSDFLEASHSSTRRPSSRTAQTSARSYSSQRERINQAEIKVEGVQITYLDPPLKDTVADNSKRALKVLYKNICEREEEFQQQKKARQSASLRHYLDVASLEKRVYSHLSLAENYSTLILASATITKTYDMETRLWRTCIYSLVEDLRSTLQMTKQPATLPPDVKRVYSDFLSAAQGLYARIVEGMKGSYQDDTKNPESEKMLNARPPPRWHRAVNYSGDLARYEILYLRDTDSGRASRKADWGKARKRYWEAMMLAPNNGLYYNQLAITCSLDEHPFASLYYYIRSLTVRSPFANARDSLLLLFQSAANHGVDAANKAVNFSDVEVTFTRAVGILWTKISVDQLPQTLHRLRALITKNLPHVSLQTHANMTLWLRLATITVAVLAMIPADEVGVAARYSALGLLATVFEGACEGFVRGIGAVTPQAEACEGAEVIAIEILALWVLGCGDEWTEHLESMTFWSSVATVANNLGSSDESIVINSEENWTASFINEEPLPEDWDLRGFLPFKASHSHLTLPLAVDALLSELWDVTCNNGNHHAAVHFSVSDADIQRKRYRRLRIILQRIAEKGVGLVHDNERGVFAARVCSKETDVIGPASDHSVLHSPANIGKEEEEIDYVPHENEGYMPPVVDTAVEDDDDDESVRHLKSRRRALHGTLRSRQAITEAPSSQSSSKQRESVFTPGKTAVVFDTNFYIGRLDEVKSVVESGNWVVSLPLVVITELDGLKAHPGAIGQCAAVALSYIDTVLTSPSAAGARPARPMLKVQTASGNFLSDLAIRTENWSDLGRTNDDVVLLCARWWVRKGSSRPTSEAGKRSGEAKTGRGSDVVLVTEDVNLRLKARIVGVDVVDNVQRLVGKAER